MNNKLHFLLREWSFTSHIACALMLFCVFGSTCHAVSSKVTRHSSAADLDKGEVEDVVIGSRGTIQLGRAAELLVKEFKDVWSINSIVVSGGTVFVGTSPNGGIYKYSLGELTQVYSAEPGAADKPDDVNEPADANTVKSQEYLANEHIFAMTTDLAGRLLAGISGDNCKLLRLEKGKMETVFEPNDAKYIFAITTDDKGNILLGTGPKGKVYRLDTLARGAEIIHEARDKNILSLAAGDDGFVYAGSDGRGLVYRINPRTEKTSVLYDSNQEEITALLFAKDGDLYAAATSAKIVTAQRDFAKKVPMAGRPEMPSVPGASAGESKGGLQLKIANTKSAGDGKATQSQQPPRKAPKPGKASFVHKITGEGFVRDVFSETAVFFSLAEQDSELLVGTGNNGRLYTIDLAQEQEKVIYADEQASQITAVVATGHDVYLGTANPAKLLKLGKGFATKGTYRSDLIDAGQPAKWGKLQIEADIPAGCKVSLSSRSGNVKDVNDPSFSDWTDPVAVTEPVQLLCPTGRFCQYKLILQSDGGGDSPLIRAIAIANTVPNVAPKVESVTVSRLKAKGKEEAFKISYNAKDDNNDKLIYRIDFRKVGREGWIELKDELKANNFEWDGRTVEGGRYEVRVTASDERDNTTTTKLMASRVSDMVVIDNTAPVIKESSVSKDSKNITLKLLVSDQLSAIGRVNYTVDSNAEWKGAMPEDMVYDTTDEYFTIVIEDVKAGEHIITIKASDAVGNTMYKSFEVNF